MFKLFTVTKINKPQRPDIKKKTIELAIGGWLGEHQVAANWAGYTWPLPFINIILYWVSAAQPAVDPLVRVHEFVHVAQIDKDKLFIVTWFKYMKDLIVGRFKYGSWMNAYLNDPYEAEAYKVEDDAAKNGLPDWAKE
jgi:hypothetical protein